MSMAALRWCRPIQCSLTQKAVLWALADQADDNGDAWPSIAGLAEATCMSERAVQNAIYGLRSAGLIIVSTGGGRHRTTTYRLAMETPQEVHPIANAERVHVVRKRVQEVRKRVHLVRERVQEVHPNPQEPSLTLIEPKTKIARAKPENPTPDLPPWLPPDAWAAWCDQRKKITPKAWTQHAAELSIKTLSKLRDAGNDPRAVIEQSIANGWRGLFAISQTRQQTRSGHDPRGKTAWLIDEIMAEGPRDGFDANGFPITPRRRLQ